MSLVQPLINVPSTQSEITQCATIASLLGNAGLYQRGSSTPAAPHTLGERATNGDAPTAQTWRLSPTPFFLTPQDVAFFHALGQDLLAFYRALNRLYEESLKGSQPLWVSAYLDQGKPDSLVTYSRMRRIKDHLPSVIRPDVIPTEHGMVITELDSVPGGIGLTGCLSEAYAAIANPEHQETLVGGPHGLVQGAAAMLRRLRGERSGCVAIVVSDEAEDYRAEMTWLAGRLRQEGLEAYCLHPKDIRFTEEGLIAPSAAGEQPIAVLYRFFELFDLQNVPKAELIMYSAKKERVVVTPPFKPALEEKSAFALLHHPLLESFWAKELGLTVLEHLHRLMPRTWILDPRPLPPTAIIPNLKVGGRPVADWSPVEAAGQKDRRFVVKASGFSPLAWGSRSVSIGHDMPATEWRQAMDQALASFPKTPYVLQEFHKGQSYDLRYWDQQADQMIAMKGRARLSPYYFVTEKGAELAGILATVCSAEKKIIHGMKDAILAPCAVMGSPQP